MNFGDAVQRTKTLERKGVDRTERNFVAGKSYAAFYSSTNFKPMWLVQVLSEHVDGRDQVLKIRVTPTPFNTAKTAFTHEEYRTHFVYRVLGRQGSVIR